MEGKVKEWFDKLNDFCKDKSFRLSDNWEGIVKGLIRKNGNCPCRLGFVPCPCQFHEQELINKGKCHCGLFINKEK
jgi:ferredoxin-thioredoxin reductase catalytic subunit